MLFCEFLRSKDQKYDKNWTKETVLFALLDSFMAFLTQKLIYTINTWFKGEMYEGK